MTSDSGGSRMGDWGQMESKEKIQSGFLGSLSDLERRNEL